jgi:PAS domain S-box-containing protein
MTETLEEYKEYVKHRLAPISDILTNIAAGDFSKKLDIPEQEDEFSELYVGLVFMMEDLLEHLKEREQAEIELERNKQLLEKTVSDRTEELTKSNEQLQREISERERAEEQTKVANERLQYLLSSSSAMIYTAKASGDYSATFISDNVTEILGYKPKDFLNKSSFWVDHIHPEDRKLVEKEIQKVFDKGYHSYEYRFKSKDGSYIWVNDEMKLIRDESGKPIEIIGFWSDATKRKHAEVALRESEEKYRNLVERANDGIAIVQESIVKYINPRIVEMMGYEEADVMNKDFGGFLVPEEYPKLANIYERRMRGEHVPPIYETKILHKNGEILDVELNAGIIQFDGQPADLVIIRDIGERKRTEEKLKKSEEMYRLIFENSSDVIFSVGLDYKLSNVSPSVEQLAGIKPEYLIGRPVSDLKFLSTESLKNAFKNVGRVILGDQPPFTEYEFKSMDGTRKFVEVRSGPTIKDGKPVGITAIARDATERKLAEEKLKANEEKLKLVFNNVSDVIFTFNSDFILTSITPTVETLSGYKPEELEGKPIDDLDFMTTESMANALDSLEKVLAGEDIGYPEYEFKSKDGTKRMVEVSYTPVFVDGEFVDMICVARDITERKLAEEKLRESEEMYKSLVMTLPDAVSSTDLEGNLIYVSPRTLELHGYEYSDELLGESAFKFIHPDDHEIALKNLQKTLEDGFTRNLEYTMIKKDGSIFTGLLSAALIKDSMGQPKSFIATVRDISERKIVEEQIIESLEEKEVLIREIHHRVKNNIQVITSMLNLHTGHVTDKQYIESIKEIQNRIRTMALIHEKLYKSKDLAHIDTFEYIKDVVNSLFRVYGININMVKPNISVDNISLNIDLGIPCGLIINELVSNSLKHAFSDGGEGKILIDIKPLDSNGEKISLTVSDNGSGFPENIDYKNTETLGLQLVNTLVDQLDGTIELNTNGKTEFNIVFLQEKKEVKDNA